MNIREKVERAIADEAFDRFDTSILVALVINAFLTAAAEEGWHMRPDEATGNMTEEGVGHYGEADKIHDDVAEIYRTMLAAAPEFEWKE